MNNNTNNNSNNDLIGTLNREDLYRYSGGVDVNLINPSLPYAPIVEFLMSYNVHTLGWST